MFLIRRSVGATPYELHRRYLSEHVPLALQHHPRLRRYVVNLADSPLPAGGTGEFPEGRPAVDAVGELFFEEMDDFLDPTRLYDSPEGEEAILDNARSLGGTALGYRVQEHVHRDYTRDWPLGQRSPGVKQVVLVRRAAGTSPEQFAAHWLERHAPLALTHHPGVWKYVANVVVERLHPGAPEIDGIAELHFRSLDDLEQRRYDSDEGRSVIAADVARFIGATAGFYVSEYVQKAT